MFRDRRWLLVGAVAVGFGVVAVWRSGVLTADRAGDERAAREARERGQRAFRSLDTIDLATADAANIADTLRRAQVQPDPAATPAVSDTDAARLLELCGDLCAAISFIIDSCSPLRRPMRDGGPGAGIDSSTPRRSASCA